MNNLDNRINPAGERTPSSSAGRDSRSKGAVTHTYTHTWFVRLNGQIFEMRCSYARTETLSQTRLSKKRSRSGKFSNAITPPPCVCLDKGIMRFYASHACFVDLQRCLCTQRHTSRLLASSFSSTVSSPSLRKEQSAAHCRLVLRSTPTFLHCGIFFSFPSSLKKTSMTLIQSVTEIEIALLSQKVRIMVFLTLDEISWEPCAQTGL